jgi:hypothetical protein
LATASQCPEKKKGEGKQQQQKQFVRSAKASARVDELTSKLDATFSMVSRLSSNIVSSVGWYVENGASKHMIFNKKAFDELRV